MHISDAGSIGYCELSFSLLAFDTVFFVGVVVIFLHPLLTGMMVRFVSIDYILRAQLGAKPKPS